MENFFIDIVHGLEKQVRWDLISLADQNAQALCTDSGIGIVEQIRQNEVVYFEGD